MQDVKSASVLFESIPHGLIDGKYTVIEDGIMRVMGRAFGMDHDTWALQMFKVGIAKGIDIGNLEEPKKLFEVYERRFTNSRIYSWISKEARRGNLSSGKRCRRRALKVFRPSQ